jgi:hypothetical protein
VRVCAACVLVLLTMWIADHVEKIFAELAGDEWHPEL